MRHRKLVAAAAFLLPVSVSAQVIDLTANNTGVAIGDKPVVNGVRINFRDRHLERVNGVDITVWTPYEPATGAVNGVAIGLPATGAADITGIGAGIVGVGGVGLGAGGDMVGIMLGGIGVGGGGSVTGISIGGIGVGAGGSLKGIQIGGI